jgi:hypothetical protein
MIDEIYDLIFSQLNHFILIIRRIHIIFSIARH